jgi:hypothetical protein
LSKPVSKPRLGIETGFGENHNLCRIRISAEAVFSREYEAISKLKF